MAHPQLNLEDVHRLLDILHNIDVGLVMLDQDYKIQLWNNFMESHSGLGPQKVMGQSIFELFPYIDETWFKQKVAPVFQLRSRAFTAWQQRPYVFRFNNTRPITGRTELMFQNVSFIPLEDATHQVNNICLIVYDVTEVALRELALAQ